MLVHVQCVTPGGKQKQKHHLETFVDEGHFKRGQEEADRERKDGPEPAPEDEPDHRARQRGGGADAPASLGVDPPVGFLEKGTKNNQEKRR